MFFRREKPKPITFEQRLEELRRLGFKVEASGHGRTLVSRDGCGVLIEQTAEGSPRLIGRAGLMTPQGIAKLVDSGYQKFFLAPDGARKPALSSELKTLHNFEEDLREGLGMESLYNESLGTVSTTYLYDRVQDRDRGVPKRPWE